MRASKSPSRTAVALHVPQNTHAISWAPSNQSTLVMARFCSVLGITDARYDINVYGSFMKDVPSRLGSNPALDASVRATLSIYSAVHARNQSVESLALYGKALEALRRVLMDPAGSRSANTLCAMYLMMVCQVRIYDHCISTYSEMTRARGGLASTTIVWATDGRSPLC